MYVSPSVGTSASSPQLHDSKRRGFAKSSTRLSRNWFRRSKGMDPKIPVYTLVHKDHTKASSSNRVDVIPLSNISAPPCGPAHGTSRVSRISTYPNSVSRQNDPQGHHSSSILMPKHLPFCTRRTNPSRENPWLTLESSLWTSIAHLSTYG